MELHENCFFLVGSKLDFFQVFCKYNFFLSFFSLKLCWDAKKQFLKKNCWDFMLLYTAGFLNADRVLLCRSIV